MSHHKIFLSCLPLHLDSVCTFIILQVNLSLLIHVYIYKQYLLLNKVFVISGMRWMRLNQRLFFFFFKFSIIISLCVTHGKILGDITQDFG